MGIPSESKSVPNVWAALMIAHITLYSGKKADFSNAIPYLVAVRQWEYRLRIVFRIIERQDLFSDRM